MTQLETTIMGLGTYSSLSIADNEEQATTTCVATTATTALNGKTINIEIVNNAVSYVESMSEEELASFEKQLSEKGLEFEFDDAIDVSDIKVYKKK